MTALAPSPAHMRPGRAPSGPAPAGPAPGGSPRGTARRDLFLVLAVSAAAGVVSAIGLARAPARTSAEGALAASAYAVAQGDGLGPGRLDAPPLAALQVGGWEAIASALPGWDGALGAGREALLVLHVAAVALTVLLARRVGLPRVAALGAGLVLALSPLAVEESRRVTAAGAATPWMLVALVLAAGQTRLPLRLAASAAALAVAVLTAPVTVLAVPVAGWLAWRAAGPGRRHVLLVPTAVLLAAGGGYAAAARAYSLWPRGRQGWPWPAPGAEGLGAGRALDGVREWAAADPVLAVATAVAALLALRARDLRPLAVLLSVLLLVPFTTGAPPAHVVPALPVAAVLVTGVVVAEARRARQRPDHAAGRWLPALCVGFAACLAVLAAAVSWAPALRTLLDGDADAAYRSAAAWVLSDLPPDARVVTDEALLPELVAADRPGAVAGYADVDGSDRDARSWRGFDAVVVTPALRARLASAGPAGATGTVGTPVSAENAAADIGVLAAVRNSSLLAVFDSSDGPVEIRRIEASGSTAATDAQRADTAARVQAGSALAQNPRLDAPPAALRALAAGRVDSRVLTVLALALGEQRLRLAGFPSAPGEPATAPARSMTVTAVDGRQVAGQTPATRRLLDVLRAQPAPYSPRLDLAAGRLVVTFAAPSPLGLLPPPDDPTDEPDFGFSPATPTEDS
ncbi:thioesterase domain-containing protein [Motilibacter deserti]|uniref:Dolichyl-phosphate-mannose-protein mannosyltransferase n=1 Tax=Motilibacter deserti TaxID=2714956 RepID=A0ABX0GUW6_9ACTN|nr:hypothetical protein [Motilibacter deserti]NHC13457.1 hypothetical protein [Motilibacter deserti]